MNRGLSLYFDFIRTVAALEVFVFHLRRFGQLGVPSAWWNDYGHEAVILFFVLSGYVVTFAARERDRDLARFAVSRITRIFSVTVSAVFLTVLFDRLGRSLDPALYAVFPANALFLRLSAGLALLNESWIPIQMFSNTPFWSVAYEFWYYFLFATMFFLRGRRRWAMLAIVAMVAGPRALLLFPIWLMGSWAFDERLSSRLPRWGQALLAVAPLIGIWAYAAFNLQLVLANALASPLGPHLWRDGLNWSRFLLSDTLLGVLITMHFIGLKHFGPMLARVLEKTRRPVRLGADYSFTLYALHQPTLLLGTALIERRVGGAWLPWAVAVFTLIIVLVVGSLTERRRHLLKPIIRRAVGAFARRLQPPLVAS